MQKKNYWLRRITEKIGSIFFSQPVNQEHDIIFDSAFYKEQVAKNEKNYNLLGHFKSKGWKKHLNPHPLFDTEYYLRNNPDVEQKGINPLLHYLDVGTQKRRNPHPLFDTEYYLVNNPDVELSGINPLLHYIKWGALEKRNPHPLFDTIYYFNNGSFKENVPDLLTHFIHDGAKEGLNPHPNFNTNYYKTTYLQNNTDNPLIHYLHHPYHNPSPCFNPYHYFINYPDFTIEQTNPLIHFLHGLHVNRPWTDKTSLDKNTEELKFNKKIGRKKRLLYIVSHEASRTGAPAIILNLTRFIANLQKFEIVIFMHNSGPLLEDFQKVGHVVCIEEIEKSYSDEKLAERTIECYSQYTPALAIVNSMESSYFTNVFGKNNIPVVTLIHEFVTFYSKKSIENVIENSEQTIFPSNFIKNIATENFHIDEKSYTIISQGLLNPRFGTMDKSIARNAIRKEFDLPANAFIVLGCGTASIRKGIDYFVQVLANLKTSYELDEIYFVWLGEKEDNFMFNYFLNSDIRKLDVLNQIIFAGAKDNVEPYFVGSNIFFLTSREDPFPCVIHEAMAASLPVVIFENTGGASEAIGDTGVVVPYGDISFAAEEIFKLYMNDNLREILGRMAKHRVHDCYNFHNYCCNIIEYIRNKMGVDLENNMDRHPQANKSEKVSYSLPQRRKNNCLGYNIKTNIKSKKRALLKPIFIAGTSRSGTSIMKLALRPVFKDFSTHEGHLWPLYKDIHEVMGQYVKENKNSLQFDNTFSLTGEETLLNAVFNVFHDIHIEDSFGNVFIDKTPERKLVSSLPTLQAMYPGMRVIFMKRHGINTIESKSRKFPESPFGNRCLFWQETMEEWLKVKNEIRHFIEIDQGELLLDPESCSHSIANFLNLTDSQKDLLLDTFKTKTIEQTSTDRTINKRLNETEWDAGQKDSFVSICGSTMKKFNYSY